MREKMNNQVFRTSFSELIFIAVTGKDFSALGHVTEIRPTGVIYEYIDNGKDHPDTVSAVIFSRRKNIYVKGVHCRLLSSEIQSQPNFSLLTKRRCILKLGRVNSEQKRDLLKFE